MAKRRKSNKRQEPKQKITLIFFHGDAMDLVDAIESKIKENGDVVDAIGRAFRSMGIPVPMTPKRPPPAPGAPN